MKPFAICLTLCIALIRYVYGLPSLSKRATFNDDPAITNSESVSVGKRACTENQICRTFIDEAKVRGESLHQYPFARVSSEYDHPIYRRSLAHLKTKAHTKAAQAHDKASGAHAFKASMMSASAINLLEDGSTQYVKHAHALEHEAEEHRKQAVEHTQKSDHHLQKAHQPVSHGVLYPFKLAKSIIKSKFSKHKAKKSLHKAST
ncbi:hypothetical protein JR316_0008967 [Psilocybe cubensis]|uniref:Uncharacterized protein n=1 Tax=Psilocybe cubensis TaxID=181762 RepID=A0ACB8GT22_PSICU|nr:hypothetical protein JR316_0008967 [Psilocybe cubensis]KAH9478512.1 hypothetical protein JR316_0008967 [Psilocybe cubensis]